MPYLVPLQAVPNQEFSITLDGNLFIIGLRYTGSVMTASINTNGTDVIDSMRIVAGSPLIPYKYLEAGNFIFTTLNGEMPLYISFNITQNLIYFTANELAAYRLPRSLPVTAASFNPVGLPLRFSPQGYK